MKGEGLGVGSWKEEADMLWFLGYLPDLELIPEMGAKGRTQM